MSARGRRLVLAVLALSAAVAVSAQDAAPPPAGAAGAGARREEAFKIVDAYVVSNLQGSLGLSDEQFAKVLPLVTRLQSERRSYVGERTRLLREMRRALKSGTATETEVAALVKELKAVEADGPARVRKQMDALDAALSPLQQGKYRLLELDVEQRLRQLMSRMPPNRPGAARQQQP